MIAGQTLVAQGSLDDRQLALVREALASGQRMEQAVAALSFLNEDNALVAVAEALGLETIDLAHTEIDRSLLEKFPIKLIHQYQIFPVAWRDDALLVATSDPCDLHALDAVSAATGWSVTPVLAPTAELNKLIKANLGVGAETVDGLLAQREEESGVEVLEELEWDRSEASEMAQEASVVRLVNEILSEAVEARASDIHIESQAAGIKIRYRIDGVLHPQPMPPEINRFQAAIISRLKIMAKLNIAEKRLPQDGRIKLKVSGREIDIRLSIIPMLHGEGMVMRILDKERMNFSLRGVGMDEDVYAQFSQLIKLPHGIILVTGPTGSGKTTSLYSALSEIKNEEIKIITTEDPVEYQLDGINQIQVHPKVGLTFAASLRSILRHDPDVVLVGEIRDLETAENAIQASLTGHLVFSTLHTNDAAGAFMRIVDMGVEPFLVSSTVAGVMAQRLVRVVCTVCRQPYEP
jgi:type II secretory ATPase GspE/PulE/Tfp pilus assembly ATPase PilB-like protein